MTNDSAPPPSAPERTREERERMTVGSANLMNQAADLLERETDLQVLPAQLREHAAAILRTLPVDRAWVTACYDCREAYKSEVAPENECAMCGGKAVVVVPMGAPESEGSLGEDAEAAASEARRVAVDVENGKLHPERIASALRWAADHARGLKPDATMARNAELVVENLEGAIGGKADPPGHNQLRYALSRAQQVRDYLAALARSSPATPSEGEAEARDYGMIRDLYDAERDENRRLRAEIAALRASAPVGEREGANVLAVAYEIGVVLDVLRRQPAKDDTPAQIVMLEKWRAALRAEPPRDEPEQKAAIERALEVWRRHAEDSEEYAAISNLSRTLLPRYRSPRDTDAGR